MWGGSGYLAFRIYHCPVSGGDQGYWPGCMKHTRRGSFVFFEAFVRVEERLELLEHESGACAGVQELSNVVQKPPGSSNMTIEGKATAFAQGLSSYGEAVTRESS